MHHACVLRIEEMNENVRRAMAIQKKNKEKILKVNPYIKDTCGIYFLTRTDENGVRHSYVGQAKHLLTRLAQHLSGYQYIDISIKKHGLWSNDNKYGWTVNVIECDERELDILEQRYILAYAKQGYQSKNKTAGGQGEGKVQIAEYKPSKTYRDGVLQGKKALSRDLKHIMDKHLTIELKEVKKGNKTSQKALEKFMLLLDEEQYKE